MGDSARIVIGFAVGVVMAQLATLMFYDELADRLERRHRGRRVLGRRVTLPTAEEWIPGDPPLPWDEGHVQRGNGHGGPTTPKPDVIPKPQPSGGRLIRGDQKPPNPGDRCNARAYWGGYQPRSITIPDPDLTRRPTNPYTGKPMQPNPPPSNP